MSNGPQGFSERVHPKIQEVIERQLSEDGKGGMLTGFLAIYTYIDEDGDNCWGRIGEVPMITAVGMADTLHMTVHHEAQRILGLNGHD